MKIRYFIPLVTLLGCTPSQIQAWVEWNDKDPVAAQAFLDRPEIQEEFNAAQVAQFNYNSRWDNIAHCESGGNWNHRPVTNRSGTYSGGLMIWNKAWVAYGGTQYASLAYLASKEQQIDIAENILDDQGWGAWDCY